MQSAGAVQIVELHRVGERLAGLRLCDERALDAVRRSLDRHGQLAPLVTFHQGGQLEIVDGFKRVRAARALGWTTLRTLVGDLGMVEAKVRLVELHERRRLTELEEGWLVRSLHREDGLSQGAIAHQLGRHKSWVCRRLLLVERLDDAVQGHVRLGLVAPRAAVALALLPRGNQPAASEVVARHGLTVRQTELFVGELLEQPDDDARAECIARRAHATPAPVEGRPGRAQRSEADWIATDVATLLRVAGRLEARLLSTPLGALGTTAGNVVLDGLVALEPVVVALGRTLATVTGKERAA